MFGMIYTNMEHTICAIIMDLPTAFHAFTVIVIRTKEVKIKVCFCGGIRYFPKKGGLKYIMDWNMCSHHHPPFLTFSSHTLFTYDAAQNR